MGEILPIELAERLEREPKPVLLDIREPWEHEVARLPGSLLIPMEELPKRLNELDPERETVVYCHHGIRSASVRAYLAQGGFRNVWNLAGGIDLWSRTVDPATPRY
jgi:rhodanese-related sulfurtransferase